MKEIAGLIALEQRMDVFEDRRHEGDDYGRSPPMLVPRLRCGWVTMFAAEVADLADAGSARGPRRIGAAVP
jgi:hypothetical protein